MAADPDTQRGLYSKYRVEKVNGKPVGRCFVLDYDNDPYARAGLEAYANSCANEFTQLAADLYRELGVEATIRRCGSDAADDIDDLRGYLTRQHPRRWAAMHRNRVVAVGGSLREALVGSAAYPDGERTILYVPCSDERHE